MTLGGLLLANLLRNRARKALALLSLVTAFLLLVLLRSVSAVFAAEAEATDTRLVVMARYRSAYMIPVAHLGPIRKLEHVVAASPLADLSAFYREPSNTFTQQAVQLRDYLRVNHEIRIAPDLLERMERIRSGAVISQSLADEHGWEAGDRVPLESTTYPREDGSRVWEFQIVGTFSHVHQPVPKTLLFNYEYYAASTVYNKNVVGLIVAGVDRPANVAATLQAIDDLFVHSSQPTNTETFDYVNRNYGRRLGDVGSIAGFIMVAVFFTVLLVTGNVTAQDIRERRREFAVMKTLGFRGSTVSLLVIAETVLLFLVSALLGIGLAFPLESLFRRSLVEFVGVFSITGQSVALALLVAVAGGVAVAIGPARSAARAALLDDLGRA